MSDYVMVEWSEVNRMWLVKRLRDGVIMQHEWVEYDNVPNDDADNETVLAEAVLRMARGLR